MKKINFVNNDAPYLSAENLNQMQDNIEEAIDKKIENGAYCQTLVTTATNGIINYDISSLGLSDRPAIVLLTPQSQLCSMQYDFDNSTSTNLHIVLGGDLSNFTGAIRFCYLIVPL